MALASSTDLTELLQKIANTARQVTGARYAAVGVLAEDESLGDFVYSGVDHEVADRIGKLPVGKGVLGVILEEDEPLILDDISQHPQSVGFPEHHPDMTTFLGVPIIVRGQIFGRLYVTDKSNGEFDEDDAKIAQLFAAQAGVAVEGARLQEEVRARGEELAVLEERDRISKELHDGVIQSIYSAGLSLQGSTPLFDTAPEKARERVNQAIESLDEIVRDVRAYIFDLSAATKDQDFEGAVRDLLREFEVNTMAEVDAELDPEACELVTLEQRPHVVQMVREILSNIARHGRSKHLTCNCKVDGETISVTIEDDGVGFDPARAI